MKYAHLKRLGDDALYAALKRNDFSRARTAQELLASVDAIRLHVRRLKGVGYKIPADPALKPSGLYAEYIPTPDEIVFHCRKFQDGWTQAEERHRRNGRTQDGEHYEFPRVRDLIKG